MGTIWPAVASDRVSCSQVPLLLMLEDSKLKTKSMEHFKTESSVLVFYFDAMERGWPSWTKHVLRRVAPLSQSQNSNRTGLHASNTAIYLVKWKWLLWCSAPQNNTKTKQRHVITDIMLIWNIYTCDILLYFSFRPSGTDFLRFI